MMTYTFRVERIEANGQVLYDAKVKPMTLRQIVSQADVPDMPTTEELNKTLAYLRNPPEVSIEWRPRTKDELIQAREMFQFAQGDYGLN
jgi:hypothetical protein